MKKHIIIALLIISSILTLSCSNNKSPGDNLSDYTIIYPECMGTYAERFSTERYSAIRLQSMIKDKFGITLTVQNDTNEKAQKEILIGAARETEATASNEGYTITKNGSNISITAGGIYPYSVAFDALLDSVAEDITLPKALSLSEEKTSVMDTEKDFVYIDKTLEEFSVPEYAVKKLTVNNTDISKYKIIYHVWGSPTEPHYGLNEEYAAQQLQRYIRLATGIELPIETDESKPTDYEIVVGITSREGDVTESIDRSEFGDETVIIKTEGTRLIISGSQRSGTIYAAYSFLEEYLGVRFFTEDCEVIYKADSIDISDISEKRTPVLEFRDNNQKMMLVSEYSSKRKINSNFRRILNYKQGGTNNFACEFPHTMETYLKLENSPGFDQPCFTDEETYQTALTNLKALLERSSNANMVSVTHKDNGNNCKCTSCMKIILEENGSAAAPMIRFINRLADDIKDEYPDVKILTFAYTFSIQPPKTAPRDNVIIMYCPIDSCCACALNDPNCRTNVKFAEYLEGWKELTDNIYIWYYVAEYTQNDTLPFMNFDAIYENYQYFKSLGVKGIFNQAWMDNEGNEFDVLRAYVLSLMMWDTDMTYTEYYNAIYEFIDAYYGEGSYLIREYFNAMRVIAKDKHFTQYASLAGTLDISRLRELSEHLDGWWEILNSYEYENTETQNRINRIYIGYEKIINKI